MPVFYVPYITPEDSGKSSFSQEQFVLAMQAVGIPRHPAGQKIDFHADGPQGQPSKLIQADFYQVLVRA